MQTLKEYAKNHNVSYEAVRKQVIRYHDELKGHISKINRTQYLDDDAIIFLDSKRDNNPVVIVAAGKDQEFERLQNENKNLLIKIADLQEKLLLEKDQVKVLQNEKIELLEEQKKTTEKHSKSFWYKAFRKGN